MLEVASRNLIFAVRVVQNVGLCKRNSFKRFWDLIPIENSFRD